MCGIIGFVGEETARLEEHRLERARDLMRHRGPDSGGLHAEGPACLYRLDRRGPSEGSGGLREQLWILFVLKLWARMTLDQSLSRGHSLEALL